MRTIHKQLLLFQCKHCHNVSFSEMQARKCEAQPIQKPLYKIGDHVLVKNYENDLYTMVQITKVFVGVVEHEASYATSKFIQVGKNVFVGNDDIEQENSILKEVVAYIPLTEKFIITEKIDETLIVDLTLSGNLLND